MDNYDFSSRARDTHEYHSFILGKTREGFTQLETHLANQGFELDGRMVICGYQEDAVPSYYSSSTQAVIDDEKHKKSTQGWQFAAGNLFGFATGFLLKDVNCLKKVCDDPIFEHSMPDRIGLFDDRASIFHRHAFGHAYDAMMQTQKVISKALIKGTPKEVVRVLKDFWRYLYVHEIEDASQQLIATQDILFSIHYGNYIYGSALPLLKFFF